MQMRIPQVRPPHILAEGPSYDTKVALIGCGPASVSCATFLARLGYRNLKIFEKEKYIGGLSSSEIPQYRLPINVVHYEIQLMKDLGVEIQNERKLGTSDITITVLFFLLKLIPYSKLIRPSFNLYFLFIWVIFQLD